MYTLHTHIMTDLYNALCDRFDDMDEIKDVAEYGCAAGVSGFIYSTELCEFFDKHEDEIELELDGLGYRFHDLVDTDEFYTMQDIKEQAVWVIVETFCHSKVDAAYDAA